MFAVLLRRADHIRRFTIRDEEPGGWVVLEETEGGVIRHVRYDDWHRVERARAAFDVTAEMLRNQGWVQA